MQTRLFASGDNASDDLRKTCPTCGLVKPIVEFPRRTLASGKPQAYCLSCQRTYSKAHYRAHKADHNRRRRRNETVYRSANRNRLARYLSGKACIDCGESDPVVLEFDHVRGTKHHEIGLMIARSFSWSKIALEIAKCDIRCANCHRRKTALQFGWEGWKRLGGK
jgi:ribosomal protein S15P/S13E